MAYDKSLPHALVEFRDKAGNHIRWGVTKIKPDGSIKPCADKSISLRLVDKYPDYNGAQARRQSLQRTSNHYSVHGPAHDLPEFMAQLPTNPRDRREFFLSLDLDEQEELFYGMTTATGRSRLSFCNWLMVTQDEVEHIAEEITTAARAELELRIAKKMIGHALKDQSPTSMTATLFLSKAFLKWTETGMGDEQAVGAAAQTINLNIVSNDTPERAEMEAALNALVAVAEKKAAR